MTSVIKLSLLVVAVVLVSSQRVVVPSRDVPPNLPWIPTWVECDFDYSAYRGPVCQDCYSVLHCTPKGGVLRNCFGWNPYCVNGICVKEPSAECAEVETVTDVNLNDD